MAERLLGIVLGLLGLLAIGALALLGYDVYRAARTGPRWRRRLLGAGLALLAALGIPACGKTSGAGDPTPAQTNPASGSLTHSPQWQRLVAAWREAEAVASGKRGDYPFDQAGQKRILDALTASAGDADALAKAGQLTEAEACLLKLDLAELTRGVQAKRPTEMRMASCYEAMRIIPARDSMQHLSARLPLLERLAAGQKLQPDALRMVMAAIERDLAILARKEMTDRLPEADRPRAEELRQSAEVRVRELKSRLPETGLEPKR